jgi:hypothetical protein
MEDIVIEFQEVTKYPLVEFLTKYRDFMLNSYPEINSYFSGETTTIDNSHLLDLKYLTNEVGNVMAQFKNFANKFDKCGFWELMDYISTLEDTIDKINKLPKFRRTSLTKRGYQPVIQVATTVGGFRTMEDVANSVKHLNQDNTNWVDLMLGNDLNEIDWEINTLTPINVFINNAVDITVNTILDQPIGTRIYGKDINRKITFVDNDLDVKEYQENVEQKCDILMSLIRGDVPENMLFGQNSSLMIGVNAKNFSYAELVKNLQETFLQDDLFQYVEVTKFDFREGNMQIYCEIKTKYDYKTERKIVV